MKYLFDELSESASIRITQKYSTSFSTAVKLLDSSIRQDIYNIYGFVRVADEIVDSFVGFSQKELLDRFEDELWFGLKNQISTDTTINAFQTTVLKYAIPHSLIISFLKSMRADLTKSIYTNEEDINNYIYGSADVVGLMCLMVFVNGNEKEFNSLKSSAVKLGSAFQKVNFLRDLKQDVEELNRTYFPNIDPDNFRESDKRKIIQEIEEDFALAKEGIKLLPSSAKFGVYVAFKYYSKLLDKLKKTTSKDIKQKRIRVSKLNKIYILVKSYIRFKLNIL
jgi:phytoene/squalene synthetase